MNSAYLCAADEHAKLPEINIINDGEDNVTKLESADWRLI